MRFPAPMSCTLVSAIVSAIACSCSLSAMAQATAAAGTVPPASVKAAAYADESIVIERSDCIYTLAADGTGFQDRNIVARVQSDAAARALGVVSIAFAGNSQHVEFLYARVRHPDGTVVESTPADAIEMPAPVTREAPFYSDIKEKQLPIRSLRVGDTLEWKARITITKSETPGQTWGQESFVDDSVVLAQTIELRVPVGMYFKVWSPTAKPIESDLAADGIAPALHVYRWTTSQLKPMAGKEAEAAAEAKKKTVWTADQELDAEQGKLPSIAWTTFKSWGEVGAWYRVLEGDRATPSPEIKAKVAELIAGKTTDEEKVRALYGYVATQIRYIGVAFGIGRIQPHTAAEILGNQYGDCKDKHTLLAAMLSAAGIESDAAMIGAGVRFNAEVPSPSAFNHMITHLTVAGQPVWLDTTAEIAPYRMLVSVIRDKQALIIPTVATKAAYIERTPADPPFATFQTMDAVGTLDKEGVSHSRLTLVVRGDTELIFRAAFHQTAPAQYNELVQQIVHGMGYGGTTSNSDVSRPEDTTAPFKMSYDYERDKPNDWTNYQIVPQIAPVSLARFGDSDPLVRVLDLGFARVETSHAAIKIPDGWGATLPEASHHKCAFATYDETYRLEKGTIYTERRIEILKQKVPTADLKAYKKWADDADLGNELYIQLVRTSGSGSKASSDKTSDASSAVSSGPPVMLPGSAEAAIVLQKASELYQQHDFDGVARLLDQVTATNPEQQYLWSTYGALAMVHNQPLEAMADFQKEIKLHPDSLQYYGLLVQLESSLGEKKEMLDTLRAWVAAAPTDPNPVLIQMNRLVTDGDAKAAATLGEAALPKLGGDAKTTELFRAQLGAAQLRSGETMKGKASLEAILNDTDTAMVLNNAAYELADANLDLPLAEKSVRTAIEELTEQSSTASLDQFVTQLFLQASILPVWDSMGWILFREGKLDEAQSYLQASWLGAPGGVTGEHLGDLLAARGEKSAAMAAYELGVASSPTYDGMGVRMPPNHEGQELQRKINALKKSGIKSTIVTEADPYKVLQNMRTIRLSDEGGRTGEAAAEYRILLKAGRVVKVQPAGEKSIAGAEDWIAKVDFGKYFPVGSQITLIRKAFVNCHAKVCELVLEP